MARVLGDRRSSGELAGVIGAAPWQIDRARRDLSGWSEGGLASAIVAVAAADANVKGATRDPVYALERMVTVVANYGIS
jgi:DNA polymerase-3 subunit delta